MIFEPVNPNKCRVATCDRTPDWVGTWTVGHEKGLRIPYCQDHGNPHFANYLWTDVTPWPDRTVDEILEEFYKELDS